MTNSPRAQAITQRQLPPRTLGFIALAATVVVSWLGIWLPIHEAANHARAVSVSLQAAILAPMMFVVGVLYTFAPALAIKLLGMPGERKATTWLILIPLLVAGWVLYLAVKAKVESYGYQF